MVEYNYAYLKRQNSYCIVRVCNESNGIISKYNVTLRWWLFSLNTKTSKLLYILHGSMINTFSSRAISINNVDIDKVSHTKFFGARSNVFLYIMYHVRYIQSYLIL